MAGAMVALLLKYCNDWHAIFYVPGIIAIIASIYIFLSLRDSPSCAGLPSIEEYKKEKSRAVSNTSNKHWYIIKKYILKNPYIWYLCLVVCFTQMVRFSTSDWATKFLYEARGIDKIKVVYLWNISFLLGMPGGLLGGYLASRFFKGFCSIVLLTYLFLLACVIYLYILFAGADNFLLTCVLIGSISFFVDGICVLGEVIILRLTVREASATVTGITGGVSYILGSALGANFLAVYIIKFHGCNALYYLCIGCVIVSMLLCSLCIKKEYSNCL